MRNTKLRKQIFLSLLVAIGVAIGFIENSIPLPIAMPGARLGLSNIVILTSIVVFGWKEGITVALLKSVLLMLVTGNVMSFFYSFAGAFLSSIFMSLFAYKVRGFSLIGVSLVGSLFHNIGQVTVAYFIVQNIGIFSYLPLLLVLGIFTGIFVGIASKILIQQMEKIGFRGRMEF
ncbi:Gx transporter family protein [Peptoniphilus sp. KCTC 25270]|uniref:Gx transporter family protein n=1 Tax=Peptoniphilus sp. KCTC 25270 TaxID=2897414 RepID=UPI001E4398E4|nr:Gx transporter family protein [Peptoniphilus sp. KCTC 25270]MCD1146907.1 Gx transporter family protein [Peptoniphilus sp. KCTC 25270]